MRTGYVLPLAGGAEGQIDMARPETLRQFLTWVRETSAARNVALFVSAPDMLPFEPGSAANDVPDTAQLLLALEGDEVDVLVLDRGYSAELSHAVTLSAVCDYLVLCQTGSARDIDYRTFCSLAGNSAGQNAAAVAMAAMKSFPAGEEDAAIVLECGRKFASFVNALMGAAEDKAARKKIIAAAERADIPRVRFADGRRQVYADIFSLIEKSMAESLAAYQTSEGRDFVAGRHTAANGLQGLSVFLPVLDESPLSAKDIEAYAGTLFAVERGEPWVQLVQRLVKEDGIRRLR